MEASVLQHSCRGRVLNIQAKGKEAAELNPFGDQLLLFDFTLTVSLPRWVWQLFANCGQGGRWLDSASRLDVRGIKQHTLSSTSCLCRARLFFYLLSFST